MLKLGYKASAEQFAPTELADYVVEAETAGFDSAFISDHFQPWRHSGGHSPFSLSWLGAVGARTSTIELGTSVLTPTFRYHPSIIAQAFATLACMFPGRIILGIGTGESLNETPATGLVWPEQRERTRRLTESVKLIRRLWREERVNFEGEYFVTKDATIYDRPKEEVRIFIAGAGPFMAKYAGQNGDGFICTSGKADALYTETLLPNLKVGLARAKVERPGFERMIEMKVSFDEDIDQARENTRFWGALALTPEEKMSVEDPIKMEKLADSLPVERTEKRWLVSSNPDHHVEQIKKYIDLGFDHLVFHAPGNDQSRFLKTYSKFILPALRRL